MYLQTSYGCSLYTCFFKPSRFIRSRRVEGQQSGGACTTKEIVAKVLLNFENFYHVQAIEKWEASTIHCLSCNVSLGVGGGGTETFTVSSVLS